MKKKIPEDIVRGVIDRCADCDVCRHLMDINCLMFPELYRLYDREKETGQAIGKEEIRILVDLCNFCALCPCANIRSELMKAKAAFVDRDGMKASVRILEDVALVGKACGALPGLTNRLVGDRITGNVLKRVLGIHPDRNLPTFPRQHFQAWAKKKGLHKKPRDHKRPKVAYFAGCTAGYLYPEVAKAVVSFLERCNFQVWLPPQQCCGMPAYLEGDRKQALASARNNMTTLNAAVESGFDIVCSCPTCGFMFRNLLKSGACYAREYQTAIKAPPSVILKPAEKGSVSGKPEFVRYNKSIYGKILADDGMFAPISALARMAVAERVFDLGEYIVKAGIESRRPPLSASDIGNIVYFPPCHQREQEIGAPYLALLKKAYGGNVAAVKGGLYCCGMAGIMGFKKEFHAGSQAIGKGLFDTIAGMRPDVLVTDCLSCRLQFEQFTPFSVKHPIELL